MSAGGPSPGDPYANPEISHFLGSMEGIPDFRDIAETPAERLARESWRASGHAALDSAGRLAPGLCLALLIAVLGRSLSDGVRSGVFGFSSLPLSPILLAILMGLLLRNTLGLPAIYEDGLRLCIKRILRIGVALLGIRLGLVSVGTIGLMALPLIILCIATAIVVVQGVSRWWALPARLGTLIAVGTAICGNTAIVATGPVIQANEDEISYAVGTITLFGLVALVIHPFIAHLFFGGGALEAGLFLGTAIHDTAQVAGAGLLYSQQYDAPSVLDTATVTKLVRNLFMIAVIPMMALVHQGHEGQAGKGAPPLRTLVPTFVLGFLAMVGLRTLGDLGDIPFAGLFSVEQWQGFIAFISTLSTWCLTAAMAAVGLGTHLARLRGLGWRPLGVGLVAAVTVGGVSAAGIALASWAWGGLG
ncbi:MAG: putative sulfate exporter family transporter [Myxococcota bacterium]|nr:putative sulfate exporter family transporter [Myxococcota bacterium]